MKKLTILIVLACIIQATAISQSCLPDGINFSSQIQIDNFQTNHPGCTEIEGDVEIGIFDCNITNLNGLSVLNSIGGKLRMHYLDSLINLSGLENLTSINGNLEIINVDSITNLSGLSGLTSIGGDLQILYNDDLIDLTGIENIEPESISDLHIWLNRSLSTCHIQSISDYLANPNGTVNIHENAPGCNTPPQVANAGGFTLSCLPYGNYYFVNQSDIDNFQTDYPNCSEINGNVIIEVFTGSTNITNLYGLDIISSINGDLKISKNDSLISLIGLEGLTTLQGSLIIGDPFSSHSGNAILPGLKGLDNLTSIEGNLEIGRNDNLNDLSNLRRLFYISGDLIIYNNNILSSLVGLDSLITLGGSLNISGNLQSLNGLEGLTKIIENVTINGNSSLNNLTGLNNITSIGGTFYVDHNGTLNNFYGMDNLSTIGGDFIIADNGDAIWHGNPSLRNLTGLENLSSVVGNLVIAFSDSLTNLIGLDNLIYVGGSLGIRSIPSLASLTGIENLSSIGKSLRIYNCDTLTSLTGLDNIDPNSITDLRITENSSLSDCNVLSICNYLISPNGTIEIRDNAPGCSNPEEVLDSCDFSSITNYGLAQSISIHPNPFSTSATIEYELTKASTVQITIYNHLGKQVEVIEQNQKQGKQQIVWNAEELPAGVYFCVLKTENGTQSMKMIKMK